jgi:hypothetical protein
MRDSIFSSMIGLYLLFAKSSIGQHPLCAADRSPNRCQDVVLATVATTPNKPPRIDMDQRRAE